MNFFYVLRSVENVKLLCQSEQYFCILLDFLCTYVKWRHYQSFNKSVSVLSWSLLKNL